MNDPKSAGEAKTLPLAPTPEDEAGTPFYDGSFFNDGTGYEWPVAQATPALATARL